MQKNPLILLIIALCGIALVGSLVLWIATVREHALRKVDQTSQQTVPKLEVATDPSFPEIKGELMAGFPDFPVYPGATLVASAKTNPADQPDTGYRAKWQTKDPVIQVMRWYQANLPKNGWTYEVPNDPNAAGEQIAQIKNSMFEGIIEADVGEVSEPGTTEIVFDVRVKGK